MKFFYNEVTRLLQASDWKEKALRFCLPLSKTRFSLSMLVINPLWRLSSWRGFFLPQIQALWSNSNSVISVINANKAAHQMGTKMQGARG